MKTIYTLALALACSFAASVKAQLTTTLTPTDDAYFISLGGGQGANPIMKFNLSSIPAGSNIVQANLHVYVFDTTTATNTGHPCGNMIFRNLNNKQNWTETDSAYSFSPNQCVFSDSVTQLSGFGDSIGWAMSSDLKTILAKDFNQSHTYCTISMKDPDDATCCGATGPGFSSFLGNSSDTIMSGNPMVGSDAMYFRPKNYANASQRPYLVVKYTCSVPFTQTITLCAGDSIKVGNSVYKTSGTYQDVLTCVNGCDSMVTTNLTVKNAIASSQSFTLCAGDSIMVGTSVHKNTGVYQDVLTAQDGCDSTVTTNLTVNAAIDITVSVAGNTLTSNEAGATYQWLLCGNGFTSINGETNQSMTVSSSGNYAVAITKNNCSDTSACTNVVFTGLGQYGSNKVNLYPNPTSGILHLAGIGKESLVEVTDVLGRPVYQSVHSEKAVLDLHNQPEGIYIVRISMGGKTSFHRISKE